MIKEAIEKILALAPPNLHTAGELEYSDKSLQLISPPLPDAVACSTLLGLVDLLKNGLDEVVAANVFLHIAEPTVVSIISKDADKYGRRRYWAQATYPKCKEFGFGTWLDPESFIIACQQGFQRVKVEGDDGSFVKDLDYVLSVASKITAEQATENTDDGFAQRVAMRQGVALKAETVLRPMVNLAPYRTFIEIDQVLSQFVFRARIQNGAAHLALFEGDGGRWKLGAVAAIKDWLEMTVGDVKVIS
jgi:hypothetical protein